MNNPVMVISNVDISDKTFESNIGTWNVTRAIKDCKERKHKMWGFCVNDLYSAIQNVEVDQEKIRKMSSKQVIKESPPVILVEEHGKIWVIDGHHRIHAHRRAGVSKIFGYVIEEKDSAPYKVFFNGERIAPWQRSDK